MQTGVKITWHGTGLQETGCDEKGRVLVSVDPALFRPKEAHYLLGDAAKARTQLGWMPKTDFDKLVSDMVNADRLLLRQEGPSWQKMAG